MLFGLLFWAFSDCQVWEMSKFEADIWQSWSTRNFFVIDTIVQKWSAFVPKFKTRLATYISWELVMEDIQYIQYIFEDHDPSLVSTNHSQWCSFGFNAYNFAEILTVTLLQRLIHSGPVVQYSQHHSCYQLPNLINNTTWVHHATIKYILVSGH